MNTISVSTDTKPNSLELQGLFAQTTWASNRSASDIETLLRRTQVFVCIRWGDRLIGFGRALSDGAYRALIDDIVVDSSFRGMGQGRIIISSLLEQLASVEEVFLNTRKELRSFYAGHGFEVFDGLTMKRRKSETQPGLREE